MPAKNMHSGEKVRPQENLPKPDSKPFSQMTPSSSEQINSAAVKKKATTTTVRTNNAIPEKIRDNAILDEESEEGKAEREEAYKDDTPEKAEQRASLEKEIRTLSQAKEKEEKELTTLIASIDEAEKNSQLPPDELKKKQAEIKMIKLLLTRTYSEKISNIDSSLQEKRQQYLDATKDKNQPPEMIEID